MINVNDIKGNEVIDGIIVLNVCMVIDALCPSADYLERIQIVSDWAQKNNLDEYSAPREHFNEYDAVRQARKDNYIGVIVEDLS